jgi:hypothetical protein
MLQHASSYMNYDRQEIDILSTGNIFNRFRIARVIITTMSGALLLNTKKKLDDLAHTTKHNRWLTNSQTHKHPDPSSPPEHAD